MRDASRDKPKQGRKEQVGACSHATDALDPEARIRRRRGPCLTQKLQVLLTESEKHEVDEAAALRGITASRFAAQSLLRDARLILTGAQASRRAGNPPGLAVRLTALEEALLRLIRRHAAERDIAPLRRLAQELETDPSIVTKLVQRLEKLRLVERYGVRGKRGVFLRLTDAGERLVGAARFRIGASD